MRLERRHLWIALAVFGAVLVYNRMSYLRSARPAALPQQPLLAGVQSPATRGASQTVDPATIPAPPTVDLRSTPVFDRDPFLFGNETRDERPQVAAAEPAPVVRSILFSPGRRLALVDGRIVGVGDKVGSYEVVDIDRTGVVVKTASGERQRLEVHGRTSVGPTR